MMKERNGRVVQMLWANLLHLSFNMWEDRLEPQLAWRTRSPHLRFDENLWNDILRGMADVGMNMVILDLGDGVRYESHPEIAVENAWTVGKLKDELAKIKGYGMEPIPKLNFATTHDAWLGDYSRQVSTDVYYAVCEELIAEVIEIFEQPRFFHIGMDEETAELQRYYEYVVVRQYDLFWRDFHFYCDQVGKGGVRPWIWSDHLWRHQDAFFKEVPKSVLQSNWYYGLEFDGSREAVKAYHDLDRHGYEQVPTASNHQHSENFGMTVDYCVEQINSSRLLGFMQTPWRPTTEEFRQRHMEAVEQVGEVRERSVDKE